MAGAQNLAELADKALGLALDLTGASVAFIGLVDEAGKRQEVFSRAAEAGTSVTRVEIDELFAAAAKSTTPARRAPLVPDHGLNDYVGLPLMASGKVIGMMGVAGGSVYTVVQRQGIAILVNQVAAAMETHLLQQRRQENENRTLPPIPGANGIDEAFIARLYPAPAEPFGSDLASQVVYQDLVFRASNEDGDSPHAHVLEVLGVSSAISVPWRAGDQRLGLVAAYDAVNREGFSMEDAGVLQMAGLAAGLV